MMRWVGCFRSNDSSRSLFLCGKDKRTGRQAMREREGLKSSEMKAKERDRTKKTKFQKKRFLAMINKTKSRAI